MNAEPSRGPNCWQCRFFAVSWIPRLPYACQRMGFKSAAIPALEVLRTVGQHCQGFDAKTPATAMLAQSSPERAATLPRSTHNRGWTA